MTAAIAGAGANGMLLLVFRIGDGRLAVEASRIVEVLPLLNFTRSAPQTSSVAGSLDYRRSFVPVVDLSELLLGRPAEQRLGTRIVIVKLALAGLPPLAGLIAENATETTRCAASDLVAPAIASNATYVQAIVRSRRGPVQLVDIDALLSAILPRQVAAKAAVA